MSYIQVMPDELLTRIFTIGGESDRMEYGSYRSMPRRMKPFIRSVSLVCHRWYQIVLAKGNFHFWRTILGIGFGNDVPVEQQGYEFKNALTESQNSDLILWWSSYNVESSFTRIALHFLLMLKNHAHQLVQLHLYYSGSAVRDIITSFLNTIGPTPRLYYLSVWDLGASFNIVTDNIFDVHNNYDVDHASGYLDFSQSYTSL